MIEDIKSFLWFLSKGPKFYTTLFALVITKFKPLKDSPHHIELATKWCKTHLSTIEECLANIGVNASEMVIEEAFTPEYKSRVSNIIDSSKSNFGGPGHTDLIYTICEKLNIGNAIETGVAYGWSSAAILQSISKRDGKLTSIDMPMLKQTDYELIGVAVAPELNKFWELRREPDRFGLPRAIKAMNGSLELVHYDSDKSYYGRKWSQDLIWDSLSSKGIFISDDIEDNSAFMEFVTSKKLDCSVLEFEGKYVGVLQKQ